MVLEPLSPTGDRADEELSPSGDRNEAETGLSPTGDNRLLCLVCGHIWQPRGQAARPQCSKCRNRAVQPLNRWLHFAVDSCEQVTLAEVAGFEKVYALLKNRDVFDQAQPTLDQTVTAFVKLYRDADYMNKQKNV